MSGLLGALTSFACSAHQRPPKIGTQTEVAGRWDFVPAKKTSVRSPGAGPQLNAGPQLGLEFGPVHEGKFVGRVVRMVSGDVVLSPAGFAPVEGWSRAGSLVGFMIALADPAAVAGPLSVHGDVKGDTIFVTRVDGDASAGSFVVPGALFVRRAM